MRSHYITLHYITSSLFVPLNYHISTAIPHLHLSNLSIRFWIPLQQKLVLAFATVHKQPYPWPHFCGSSSPISDPPLVLCSPFSLTYWANWCYHHGHLFNNCWTYTIFWHVAISLCHHHTPVSVGGEFRWRKQVATIKTVWHYKYTHRTNFVMSLPSQINMTGGSCTIHCMYLLQVLPPTIPRKVTD